MDEILRRLADNNFSELPGLKVNASIPVSESLVNEITAEAIRGNQNIRYCRVSISRQNRVSVNLKTPLWPWPLELKLRLENSMYFAESRILRARLENKVLLAKLGSFLNAMPKGVSISGDQIMIDVASLLPEQKKLLELVKSVEIRTEEGKVILDVRMEN